MKLRTNRLSFAALAIAAMGWSTSALACPAEPYISAVCIMGTTWAPQGYVAADGRQMAVSTNQALFALIGITYGGTGTTYFNVPDLRGRTVIGAGQGPDGTIYTTGQKDGQTTVTLTTRNVPLPPHVHGVGSLAATATLGTLAATTTMTGLSATTSMSGVTATAAGSGLTLNGTAATANTGSPGANALGSTGLTKVYTNATPSVAMAAGSIGGSAAVTFSGNPTTTISGSPTTSLSGAPAVTLGGTTAPSLPNAAAPFPTMMPYIVMNYVIATQGIWPTRP